jgi:hypothetical protein
MLTVCLPRAAGGGFAIPGSLVRLRLSLALRAAG